MSTFPSELDALLSQQSPQQEDSGEDGSIDQHVQDQVDQLETMKKLKFQKMIWYFSFMNYIGFFLKCDDSNR